MPAKVAATQRKRARGVSLSPEMERWIIKKAETLDITFSKYVQRLIRMDMISKKKLR